MGRRLILVLVLVVAGLVVGITPKAGAASVPSGFTDQTVASGLTNPTAMALAPDGRIFVAEQAGTLRVIKNGQLLTTPFLTLTVNSAGERGLLGVAFDPHFSTSHLVYVYYTATTPVIHNRISRFKASGDVAVGGSEQVLADLDPLSSATNHNGGALHFGTDGKLYIGVGENANSSNSQTLTNRLGKMLRINTDGSIPTDNPFYNSTTGANRSIWALGLRNPFTFGIQPGSGRLFINDVGQSTWEEIDNGVRGANYGWPLTEGPTTQPGITPPVYAYQHSSGTPTGCAITGGAFYNPNTVAFGSSYVGDYFFSDLCGGWIYSFDPASHVATAFATGIDQPVNLFVSPDGALYYLARGTGSVGRISHAVAGQRSWFLNDQNDGSSAEYSVHFGLKGAKSLSCDWDGDGIAEPVSVQGTTWSFLAAPSSQAAVTTLSYGAIGDEPICGDWDGNGTQTPGVRRGNGFHLANGLHPKADIVFSYGSSSDRVVVGNWDGRGGDGVGVVRGSRFYLTNRLDGLGDMAAFTFGQPTDVPIAGDWDANGTSTIGMRRGSIFYLRNSNSGGAANVAFSYGMSTDVPVTGDWNGDGRSTIGVVRQY